MNNNLRLMVVDDEPIVGKSLKRFLEKAGYQVDVFFDSKEAVGEIKKRSFDIIITDYKMEGYDGLQILDIAKKKDPDVKVIIITGFIQKTTESDAFSRGAFDFIIKPFKVEALKDIVKKAELEIIRNRPVQNS